MDCLYLEGSLGNQAVFRLSDVSTAAGYLINKQPRLGVLDSVMCLVQHHWSGLAKSVYHILL